MTWNSDTHGLLFRSSELKLYRPSHTWAMKLSQLHRQSGTVRIVTFRLPGASDNSYYETQIARRPSNMFVLIGTGDSQDQLARANGLKQTFPDVEVAVHPELHIKAVAIAPDTLYVGSANFGDSGWADLTLGVRSVDAHDYFVAEIFNPLWTQATKL